MLECWSRLWLNSGRVFLDTFSVGLSKWGKQNKVFKFEHLLSPFCHRQRNVIKRILLR